MQLDEIKSAHETGAIVIATVQGQTREGTVREYGVLTTPLGKGAVNRAIVIIDTGDGDFPVFFRDLSLK